MALFGYSWGVELQSVALFGYSWAVELQSVALFGYSWGVELQSVALFQKMCHTLKLHSPAVPVCRHRSHVSAMAQGGTYERRGYIAAARASEDLLTYVRVAEFKRSLVKFPSSAFNCSVNAVLNFSNRILHIKIKCTQNIVVIQ